MKKSGFTVARIIVDLGEADADGTAKEICGQLPWRNDSRFVKLAPAQAAHLNSTLSPGAPAQRLAPDRLIRRDLSVRVAERHAFGHQIHILDSVEHAGGWSVDASVTIPGWYGHGLERLARYCARPPLSRSGWAAWTRTRWCTTCADPRSAAPSWLNRPGIAGDFIL